VKRSRIFSRTIRALTTLAALGLIGACATTAPYTPAITDGDGMELPGAIASIETVMLGGIPQTITIRTQDTSKPVLLHLHGGPGMPSSPWATWNDYHAELEAEFILVHWDQRGAGKSFSEDLTAEDMHLASFVSDTLELADMLRARFGQDKIFLWGHSWGSGLGFETLRVNSEPFHAFFASAVRPDWDSTETLGFERVLELARQAKDADAIEAMTAIQPFDPTNIEHIKIRGRYLAQYRVGDFHTEGLGQAWLDYVLKGDSPEYPKATLDNTLAGMDFSRETILPEILASGYDLARDFPVSSIPVFFFAGRYDYETPGESAEVYYRSLQAPEKSFTWFENSAHDVQYDEAAEFNRALIRIAQEVLGS
jgi:pimeloyl-ACP methyl ester carboxylesterase